MPRKKVKDKMPAIQELPSGSYRVQIYIGTDAATGKFPPKLQRKEHWKENNSKEEYHCTETI